MNERKYKLIIVKDSFFLENNEYVLFLYEKQKLIKVSRFSKDKNSLYSIHLAKVKNILKNISAAFLELENKEIVYLELLDKKEDIKVNDDIVVRVSKEAIKTKMKQVSTTLEIKKNYSIVSNFKKEVKFSKNIKEPELKNEISRRFLNNKYSVLVRSSVDEKSKIEDLELEVASSVKEIESYYEKAKYLKAPLILKEADLFCDFVIGDYFNYLEEVVVEDEEIFTYLRKKFSDSIKIRLYQDFSYPLYKLYSLKEELNSLKQKKVWLKSGAYLIIEKTETLNLIDVNTGKNISKKDRETNIFLSNKEAAVEMVRQVILRNLSGIIIVDFINMKDLSLQEELIKIIKEEFKKDKLKTKVHGFTKLGLLEISRQNMNKSL